MSIGSHWWLISITWVLHSSLSSTVCSVCKWWAHCRWCCASWVNFFQKQLCTSIAQAVDAVLSTQPSMALPIPTYHCVPHPAGYWDVSIFYAEPLGRQTHESYAVCTQACLCTDSKSRQSYCQRWTAFSSWERCWAPESSYKPEGSLYITPVCNFETFRQLDSKFANAPMTMRRAYSCTVQCALVLGHCTFAQVNMHILYCS